MIGMTVQEEDGLLYLAYKRIWYIFIFGLLVSLLMVAALWPVVEHAKLSAWLAVMGVILSLSFLLAHRYLRHGHGVVAEMPKWKIAFVIASAFLGMGWGSSIWIFPTYQFDLAYLLSLFVIAGVSAFACVSKAPVLPAAAAFLLTSLSPLALSLLSVGDSFHFFAGVIVVAYLLSMLLLSRQMHQMTRVSLGLSELNKGLSAAAQESNQRMTQYFKNAPGFFHTLLRYPDGRYAMPFASEGIRDLFGIDPAEVAEDYSPIIALTHPDDAERVACLVKESAQQLTFYHVEYRIIHPQQGVRWIGVYSSPQHMPDGGTRWDGYMLDITERKEMEAQLAQREHEFRTLVENAPDIILRYDRQCRLYYANSQFEVALGGSIVPFLGKTPRETVADGRYDLYEAAMRRVISGGNDVESTLTVLDQYGEESIHHMLMTAERDESGKVVSVFVIGRDITERKRLETELQRREREFRALAENSPDPIYRYDRDGRRLYANTMACKLGGKSGAELIGKRFTDDSVLIPEQRPKLLEAVHHVFDCGESIQIDLGFVIGGDYRDYQMRLVPERDAFEQVVSVLAIARDISELKDAQRRTKQFVANFPGFVYSYRMTPDGHGSFPFASPGIEKLYGLKPEDVKDDFAALHALAHPDDAPGIIAALAESARAMSPIHHEYRICRPGLPERWAEFRSSPVREADGSIVWHGIMVDIEERKRAQQKMELLDRAIDMSIDAVYLMDEKLRFVYVNDTACRALGYSREELLAMDVCDIDPDVPYEVILKIIKESPLGVASTLETRHRARDGHTYPVEIGGVQFEEDGKKFALSVARDITARKRIEQALAVREREFRTLAENSPDVIVRYDRELRRIYINPAWEVANGVSVEEALGKRPSEMAAVVSASVREFEDRLREVLESGEPREIEFGGKDRSDNMKYFSMRVVPERGEQGEVAGLLTMANDITERKRIENELRHKREMLDDAQKLAQLGSWDWDVVRNRVEWSEMAYEIYTPDRRPAEPGFEDFTSSLHPDDRERVVAAVQSAFEHDTPFDLDHRVVSVSRGVRTVHAQGNVFRDADGKPVRMVGTVQDITVRKRAEAELQNNFKRIYELNMHLEQNARALEEQAVELEMSKEQLQQTEAWYRSILHSAPDGMLVVDEQGRIIQVNAQLEAMFGYGSGELSGCHVEVLLPQAVDAVHSDKGNPLGRHSGEGRNPVIKHTLRSRQKQGVGSLARETFNYLDSGLRRSDVISGAAKDMSGRRKDGSEFPVDVSLSRLPDLDGRVGATCAAVRDVTERQKMDVAREAALSEALRLAQLRSAFMAQMSHELRTPLNGILGYTQNLLLGDALGEKQMSGLHIIQQSGEHLLTLINGLLDHAAIEADKFELIPGDIELESFLSGVIGIIRVRAEQKNIAFTCETDADLPAVVRGDAQRLRQVLLNLLSNAVKFTDSGQVTLRVNYIAPSRLCFAVQDSGIGIAAGELENIFLPFEQIGDTSRRAGGNGLGLAISRKLVRLMGGDIKVESEPGTGSTFSFEIDMEAGQPGGATVNAVALAEQAATRVAQTIPMLSVPPKQELDILHAHALRGSMRDVMRHAEHLAEADSRYLPFADQLRRLTQSFQTKALVGLIEQCRNRKELEQ